MAAPRDWSAIGVLVCNRCNGKAAYCLIEIEHSAAVPRAIDDETALNAIVDALSELGVRHIEMPASPERVWRAIQGARAGAAG